MRKPRWMVGAVLMTLGVAGWVSLTWAGVKEVKPKAPVPETGQTQCWNAAGTLILCDGTGQDGDIRAGVAWPIPRFTNRGDGTVRDNLTGLIWLKQANCFGFREWKDALADANALHDSGTPDPLDDCGLMDGSVAGDWRLPNVKELQSLIDSGLFGPALSNAAGTGPWTEGDAFLGVLSGHYYSSTTRADHPGEAWLVDLNDGFTEGGSKGFNFLVWPVRGGN